MEKSSLRFRRGIYIASLLGFFDFGSVALMTPTVAYYKNVEPGHASWIILWYAVAFITAGLLAAQTGDKRGFRRPHLVGYSVYAVGAVLCALPANLIFLVVGRCIQGVGMAMVVVTSMGYVMQLPSADERRHIGLVSARYGIAAFGIGMLISLAFVKILPLHGVFIVQIIMTAIAFGLAIGGFESDAIPTWERVPLRLDISGAVMLLVAMVTLFIGIYFASVMGFFSRTAMICFAAALIMAATLAAHTLRHKGSILASIGAKTFCSVCHGLGTLLASAAVTCLTLTMAHLALSGIVVLAAFKAMSAYILPCIVIAFLLTMPALERIAARISKSGMLIFGLACFGLIASIPSFEPLWSSTIESLAGIGASLFLLSSLASREPVREDTDDIQAGTFVWHMFGIAVGTILLTFMPLLVSIAGTLVQWKDQTAALTWTSSGVTLLLSISGFMSIAAWVLLAIPSRR